MIRKLLLITAAAIGGIYLTSEEGKQARAALMKKKSTFEPIVKDLLKQVNSILEGSQEINSDEIRANVNLLVKEAKQTIVEIDLEKTVETVREAIKVASAKIREAENEIDKSKQEFPKRIANTQEYEIPAITPEEVVETTQTIKKAENNSVKKTNKPVAKKVVVKKKAEKPAKSPKQSKPKATKKAGK